ncbi:unnamed protein product [Amoebophrya sp. A120]|nr:unnamed protein product [Amoebophrya sp. A120]|eukprot:GSA120T00001193001.1
MLKAMNMPWPFSLIMSLYLYPQIHFLAGSVLVFRTASAVSVVEIKPAAQGSPVPNAAIQEGGFPSDAASIWVRSSDVTQEKSASESSDSGLQRKEAQEDETTAPLETTAQDARTVARKDFVDHIRGSEEALLMFGRSKLLRETQGVLSFLAPTDVASWLQTSKSNADRKDTLNAKVRAAAIEQNKNDLLLENRTESCEDLFLEVLRDRLGKKKPRDFWNAGVDKGKDFLKDYRKRIEEDDDPIEEPQILSESGTTWSVRLLMTMAAETCNPAAGHLQTQNRMFSMRENYGKRKLSKGCHRNDISFFREVLDFFHEDVRSRRPHKTSLRPDSAASGGVAAETSSAKQRKLVVWNPPRARAFYWGRNTRRAVDMASNPHRELLDARCRLAMATELLFQKHTEVYETRDFQVKIGYCINPFVEYWVGAEYEYGLSVAEEIREDWHPNFRKLFRKYAKRWRDGSDGVDLRWSYEQFQWDWRTFHAKRLRDTTAYNSKKRGGKPVPEILAANPGRFLVVNPTRIADDLC